MKRLICYFFLIFFTAIAGCDKETGEMEEADTAINTGTDGDGDGDADGDSDADSDTDGDADSDTDGDADNDSDTDTESESETECAEIEVDFTPLPATAVLLIDRSSSMLSDFGGDSRWEVARAALVDPDTGLIKQMESLIRFGLTLYAGDNNIDDTCPVLTTVEPKLNNYDDIAAVYNASEPQRMTPTGESIAAVTEMLNNFDEPGQKVIVLATDGRPNMCENAGINGDSESVEATEAAFLNDILTFVISVGEDVGDAHLQDVANAGAGVNPGEPDAPFYVTTDQDLLIAAFTEIISSIRSCTFELEGQIAPGVEDECTVEINGTAVPFDDPNGWTVLNENTIEIVGTSCDAIQEGEVNVDIGCPCGVIIID